MPRAKLDYKELLISELGQKGFDGLVARARRLGKSVEVVAREVLVSGAERKHPVLVDKDGLVNRVRRNPPLVKEKSSRVLALEAEIAEVEKKILSKEQEVFQLRNRFGPLGYLAFEQSDERKALLKQLGSLRTDRINLERKL